MYCASEKNLIKILILREVVDKKFPALNKCIVSFLSNTSHQDDLTHIADRKLNSM